MRSPRRAALLFCAPAITLWVGGCATGTHPTSNATPTPTPAALPEERHVTVKGVSLTYDARYLALDETLTSTLGGLVKPHLPNYVKRGLITAFFPARYSPSSLSSSEGPSFWVIVYEQRESVVRAAACPPGIRSCTHARGASPLTSSLPSRPHFTVRWQASTCRFWTLSWRASTG